jgi:glycosyltransferase involved in cell wall biosynthesis
MLESVRKLRILLMSTSAQYVGTWWRCFHLGRYLANIGHEVLLVAMNREHEPHMVTKRIGCLNLVLLPYFVSYRNLLTRTLSNAFSVFEQSLLNCVLQNISSPDVFHSFSVMFPQNALPTIMARLACLLRVQDSRIFVDWDDLWGHGGMLSKLDADARAYLGAPDLITPMMQFLEEKIPKCADAVTVTNETIKRHALEVGLKPEALFVIPNGADVVFFQPMDMMDARASVNLPPNRFIYTHAGSSTYGFEVFELLLKAHEKVIRSHPDCVLLLVGTLRPDEVKLLEDTGARNVLYVGQQSYNDYRLYLAASDVLLLPIGRSAYDSARSPLRLGDYLATGRPIITTQLPEIAKIVEDCGFSAKPGDPDEFAKRIIELKNDPALRDTLGKMARHKAQTELSWSVISSRLGMLYEGKH